MSAATGARDTNAEMSLQNTPTESPNDPASKRIQVGGSNCTNGKPAYAVLTGIWKNNDGDADSKGEEIVVNIPITNLPIVLGRRWGSTAKDPHHVALPRDEKSLSRLHACIFYRDAKGGKLGCYEIVSVGDAGSTRATDKLIYKPYEAVVEEQEDVCEPDAIYRSPLLKDSDPLPNGFFAIECLGRHTIKVGDKKVTKGKQAMLIDGTPIQIASYSFYFLLPKDAPPPTSQTFHYPVKKATPQKDAKPKGTAESKAPSKEDPKEPPTKKSRKSEDTYTSKLDNVSTQELISQLTTATESEEWTKEDQLISATLGMRIVREAAKDVKIQTIAKEQHGVTQRDIIDWYNANSLFSDFERLMLSKIEYKSYQSSVTKAIQRAGYTRNESNPGKSRSTRWDIPADIPLVAVSPRSHSKSPRRTMDGPEEKTMVEKGKPLNAELKEERVTKTAWNEVAARLAGIKTSTTADTEDVPLSELEKSLPPPNP